MSRALLAGSVALLLAIMGIAVHDMRAAVLAAGR